MAKKKLFAINILSLIALILMGCLSIIFFNLYLETFKFGYVERFRGLFSATCVGVVSVLTVLALVFLRKFVKFAFKIIFVGILFIMTSSIFLYYLKQSGILLKFNSVNSFRDYISGFGKSAVLIFILIQFLQVVILPIPSLITVGTGVLMFNPLFGAIYSAIGIILGSITSFFMGKLFGSKLIIWLFGEKSLNKGLALIKGKDKIALSFMFLLPLFPDDLLCFIAGVVKMKNKDFCIIVFLTRIVSIFISSFSLNNSFIPYNTWWGISIWVLIFVLIFLIAWSIFNKQETLDKL